MTPVPRCLQHDAKLKTTYEAPVQTVRIRDQPTFQSSLFTGHDYGRRGGDEKRCAPGTERGHRHTKSALGLADYSRPAGLYALDGNGRPVIAAKLGSVAEIIQMDRPAAPVKDKQTTYNGTHTKAGFACHHAPERPRPVEVKHQPVADRVPAGKRLPFEVKSRFA